MGPLPKVTDWLCVRFAECGLRFAGQVDDAVLVLHPMDARVLDFRQDDFRQEQHLGAFFQVADVGAFRVLGDDVQVRVKFAWG